MATQFKNLTFPNTPKGQKQKIMTLQKEAAEGWVVVSETITQGEFKGKKACCSAFICLPTALCAGSTDGTINVTLKKD